MMTAPIPPLSDTAPASESTAGAAGSMWGAARSDHSHQRLTSATSGTLDGNGDATVTFTRSFTAAPKLCPLYEEASNGQPVIFKRTSWVMTGALYTGVVIHGYRLQTLPSPLTLVAALVGFNVAAGSASGVAFDLIAVQAS